MTTTTAAELETRVLTVVAEVLAVEPATLDLGQVIREDLAVDSLTQLSLFMALEDEFGGSIPETEAEDLRTLGDVVEYIRARLAALDDTG